MTYTHKIYARHATDLTSLSLTVDCERLWHFIAAYGHVLTSLTPLLLIGPILVTTWSIWRAIITTTDDEVDDENDDDDDDDDSSAVNASTLICPDELCDLCSWLFTGCDCCLSRRPRPQRVSKSSNNIYVSNANTPAHTHTERDAPQSRMEVGQGCLLCVLIVCCCCCCCC